MYRLSTLFFILLPLLGQAKSLEVLHQEISGLSREGRLIKSASYFINATTGLNPLGEGGGVDPHPIFSDSKFDCTTYVETNLAIAFAQTLPDIQSQLNRIRYQADEVNYYQRNHFMISDWIPANTKKGYISDITAQMTRDKSAFKQGKRAFSKTLWFYHGVIDLLDAQKKSPKEILEQLSKVPILPEHEEKANYLTAEAFRANIERMAEFLPQVSVVMFLRNIPTTPSLVTHMGFAIKKDGKLYLNHAPRAKPWKVQEVLLENYFKDMDAHRAPIHGLIFLRVGN